MADPILHKILRGDGAERYLPFALTRMRMLEDVFGPDHCFRQSFLFDGFSIEVQQQPPCQYVRIIAADTLFFEFETTGWPVVFGDDGNYQVGVVSVEVKSGALDATLMGNERVDDAQTVSIIGRQQQLQLIDEPVSYPGPKTKGVYPRALYQSWAPKHSHTGLYLHGYVAGAVPWSLAETPSSLNAQYVRDVGFDVPWADGKDKNRLRYAYLTGTADWPRASAICLVKNTTYGDREFAIYLDAFDQVSVFPTAAITPVVASGVQNVLPLYVQRTRIPLPSWVYAKTQRFMDYFAGSGGDTGGNAFPEYEWKLHPDGTKAVAVVYERAPAVFDAAHYAPWTNDSPSSFPTKGPLPFFPTAANFDSLTAELTGLYPQLGIIQDIDLGQQRYLAAPGLLEVTFAIELTGFNLEQFTFTATTAELRRPTTSDFCPLVAGYAFHDQIDQPATPTHPATYRFQRGDLAVLDIECYGRVSDSAAASLLSLKNLTSGAELMTFGADTEHFTAWTPPATMATTFSQLLAYDMPTLSFAILHRHRARTTSGDGFNGNFTQATHFGIGIYTMGKYRTTLWPASIDPEAKTSIAAAIAAKGRDLVAGLTRMPLNDLREWGDADMDSLREQYDRSGSPDGDGYFGDPPHDPADPLANTFMDDGLGFKYYDAVQVHPNPSTAATNWWYGCLGAGRHVPFLLFNLTDPRPGWYQHMAEVMSRLRTSPWTTFFAHPNGSWAFYNQEFIYNPAGLGYHHTYDGYVNRYTCTAPLDLASFEHCIFDQVHLQGRKNAYDSSFVALYSQAVNKAIRNGTLLDAAAPVTPALLRATFGTGSSVDPFDPAVHYQTLNATWHGFNCRAVDTGYYTGTKQAPRLGTGFFVEPNYDYTPLGLLQNASLGGFWESADLSTYLVPQFEANPAQFSSCVMIGG